MIDLGSAFSKSVGGPSKLNSNCSEADGRLPHAYLREHSEPKKQPKYVKVTPESVNTETLFYYNLPWKYDEVSIVVKYTSPVGILTCKTGWPHYDLGRA